MESGTVEMVKEELDLLGSFGLCDGDLHHRKSRRSRLIFRRIILTAFISPRITSAWSRLSPTTCRTQCPHMGEGEPPPGFRSRTRAAATEYPCLRIRAARLPWRSRAAFGTAFIVWINPVPAARRESGLGLGIVRSNMELLGGGSGVENTEGGVNRLGLSFQRARNRPSSPKHTGSKTVDAG